MAEVLGVVASAIQVADLGFRLSKNIYEYASNVAGAETRIAYLGQDISLTATIIKELGGVLEDADVQALLRDSAVSAAKKAMDACSDIFTKMDLALNNSRSSRMAWPFRQVKVQVLNADLDRLKCNLLLLSEALKLARDVRRDKVDKERFDLLASLIRANTEADARFRDSMASENGNVRFLSNNLVVNATLPSVAEAPRNQSRSINGDAPGVPPLESSSKREPNASDPSIENLDQIEASLNNLIGVIGDLRKDIETLDTASSDRKSKLKNNYLHTRYNLDCIILDESDVLPPGAIGSGRTSDSPPVRPESQPPPEPPTSSSGFPLRTKWGDVSSSSKTDKDKKEDKKEEKQRMKELEKQAKAEQKEQERLAKQCEPYSTLEAVSPTLQFPHGDLPVEGETISSPSICKLDPKPKPKLSRLKSFFLLPHRRNGSGPFRPGASGAMNPSRFEASVPSFGLSFVRAILEHKSLEAPPQNPVSAELGKATSALLWATVEGMEDLIAGTAEAGVRVYMEADLEA
ncbi:hypothetical protein HDK64DRAFT_312984 [Phyllosticta capitalensis]